ncbi:MAG: ABC transporter permease [Pikeienuella sp.]
MVCLLLGYPVALVIATAEPRWKPWLLLLIMLPFWTNLLIRTYALLNILGARGRVNAALRWLWEQMDALAGIFGFAGAFGAQFTPVNFLGTELGVVLGLTYVALPFAILPIYSSLERLDRSYLEASMDLGAGQFRTFFLILVPLTSAGLATAAIITFIPSLGSFLTPDLLGRGQVDMIANVIERQFKKANDWPFGAALSLFLLYVTFIILAVKAILDMQAAKARGRRA